MGCVTSLNSGCSDGRCVVWDFQTRGIAKELKNNDHVAAITSVCWSKTGHHILASASDNSLTLWNVSKGEKVFQTILQQTHLQARLHPGGSGGSSPPSLCLVTSSSSAPFILDFRTHITTVLPISSPDNATHDFSDGSYNYTPTEACFNKSGDLVYLGNSIGEILIIDYKNNKVCGIVQIPGGAAIKNIVFSRNGQHVLTNSSDRIIRVYENLLPLKDARKFFDGNESVGLKCLSLLREFQDSVTKVHWKAPCFSGDGEWVVGGSASKGEHKIYVWDRDGLLVKLLDGPKEALVDLAWHPAQPIVVSVSLTGLVYIWVKDYTENWSVFAPDFRELDENEEYVEQEDEFDLMPETEKVKFLNLN
ncbi:putative transcription factor WD40-like family [Helianthus annuus]|nr:putative transcription factor WD40-like family [Helianthus annuus]KAJ0656626.1 putative transcription factor WD40-like family [Helianthus annuus]